MFIPCFKKVYVENKPDKNEKENTSYKSKIANGCTKKLGDSSKFRR